MDFKVTYLDAGLTSNYLNDDNTSSPSSATANGTNGSSSLSSSSGGTKISKRYKTHLRDFLSSCRTGKGKEAN